MQDKQAHIRRMELTDVRASLPAVTQWDEKINRPIDIFVTSLGFEDRSTAIPEALTRTGSTHRDRPTTAILCVYRTNRDDNERNRDAMERALSTFSHEQLELDADAPREIALTVSEAIERCPSSQQRVEVVLDISTCSGNLILSLMNVFCRFSERIALRVLYAEPARYFPEKEDYERDPETLVLQSCSAGDTDSMHEFGVENVEVNELYPGVYGESRPEYVIAVPAFRTGRLVRCLQNLTDQPISAPDRYVYWVLSDPPATSMRWRLEFQKRIVLNAMSSMVGLTPSDGLAPKLKPENSISCSTRDYYEILAAVIEEADRRIGHNLSIVHMGSKLQAIGISLALRVRSEIAVWHARPTRFNASLYSEGIGTLWAVDFGSLDVPLSALARVGELSFTSRIETDRSGLPTV